jgi:TP901 family phage tail tape measure protein
MASSKTLRVNILGDASKLNKTLGSAQKNVKGFGDKLKSAGSTMRETGKKATAGLTAPIGAVGAKALKTATDFKSAMNTVEAVTQASGKQMKGLEAQARELGSTTQFSAEQAAQGMTYLAQAGYSVEEMGSALPKTLDLAASGSLSLGKAADIASNVLSGFGKEADKTGKVVDVMAQTASTANTSVGQMGQAMAYAAPTARAAGQSLEGTAAIMGVLGDQGIQASKAGTAVRGAIASLANPSSKSQAALDKLGVSVKNSEGEMRSLKAILQDLNQAGATTGNTMQIFGRQAGGALAGLVEEGTASVGELESKLGDAEGRASQMADTKMQGLPGVIKELKSAFDELMLSIAKSGLLESTATFLKRVTELVRRVSEANPKLFRIGTAIAAVAAAIGPALVAFGAMTAAVGSAMSALSSIGAVLGSITAPMLAIPAAIAAVAAGFYLLYNRSETVREAVRGVIDTVRDFASNAMPKVRAVIERVQAALMRFVRKRMPQIRAIVDGIADIFRGVANIISSIWRGIFDEIQGIIEGVTSVVLGTWRRFGDQIIAFAERTWGKIQSVIESALRIIRGVIDTVAGLITGDWERVWKGIQKIVSGVWNAIQNAVRLALDTLRTILGTGLAVLQTVWEDVWGAIKRFFRENLVEPIEKAFRDFTGSVEDTWDSFLGAIERFFTETWESVKDFFRNNVVKPIENAFTGFTDGIEKTWNRFLDNGVVQFFKDKLGNMLSFFKDIFTGNFDDAFSQWIDGIKNIWEGLLNNDIVQFFKDKLGNLLSFFKDIFTGNFSDAFSQWIDGIKKIWNALLNNDIVQGFKDAFNAVIDWINKNLIQTFRGAIEALVDTLSNAWNAVKEAFATPINWVIDNVINRFFGAIENVASKLSFNLDLPEVGKVETGGGSRGGPSGAAAAREYHRGGVVGRDGQPRTGPVGAGEELAVLRKGETVLPEMGGAFDWVGDAVDAAVREAREMIADTIAPAVRSAVDTAKTAGDRFGMPGEMFGGAAAKLGENVLDWLKGVTDAAKEATGGSLPDSGSTIDRLIGYMASTDVPHRVTSTLRPNDSGSYHAVGRAVDFAGLSPSRDSRALGNIFWAFEPIFRKLKELIYAGPQTSFNIKNGRRVGKYAQAIHHDHVHAAMDGGGYLPPGVSMIENGTGQPEMVTAPDDVRKQNQLLERIARAAEAGHVIQLDTDEVGRSLVDRIEARA